MYFSDVSHYCSRELKLRCINLRLNVQKMFDVYKRRYQGSEVSYKALYKMFCRMGNRDRYIISCEASVLKIRCPMLSDSA